MYSGYSFIHCTVFATIFMHNCDLLSLLLQAYQQRILRPPEGASQRIHQPPLPLLDATRVREVIEEVTARNANNPK